MRRWWLTLRVGYWLGWQIESNWTDPLLFFIYSIARPLGGVLILVFMYHVVARAGGALNRGMVQGGAAMLGFFVVGTACWPFVVRGMMGTAYSLISDREHWRTLRYVYISPISLRAYLVGRALAQATSAVAGHDKRSLHSGGVRPGDRRGDRAGADCGERGRPYLG